MSTLCRACRAQQQFGHRGTAAGVREELLLGQAALMALTLIRAGQAPGEGLSPSVDPALLPAVEAKGLWFRVLGIRVLWSKP